ncbi:Asp-tRNA(Asn)/Glu-tRNA(Gln) amidotransferase subunit GatB [Thermosediminibacter oceani]|uniref:Aspartyl/glutamyl-tRNA(Asn/Gln) amidotransferase subunit B n=1 Tax=Thermosediminibacter oceani (strain ATCC BAA-1034 / DSM 16646 / JW/IW-1228P) TaxID=555079 RepID=D9S202_THEOJ|nr:Asp-tRNA(Asn)/Glu-tRNA(Gln) amidotransferase subunit GatB [Thermosediminibacter oceani]ADL07429.1 aspartyl/glutamyl-tRNA(Asn/Gln) amidotransferase subunit B [Thermosediminibacter oceani DSM 16646]
MEFETVIGLEVHVELHTKSKIFCGCTTEFGGEVNTHCCPVCLGMPGVLPVTNKKAVEYAIKAALALNCEIAEFSKFDRKNYFYPDLPKAYQISQYDLPLARNGYIEIEVDGKVKRIGINRVHLEEDAGKLVHEEGKSYSLVDLNRTGVPLIEIVSEPDIRSPEEAWLYLNKLKTILQYIEVSDCKMEEGSLRCDTNISIRPKGSDRFGTKVELKNLGSFRAVRRSLEYEEKRQREILEQGGAIVQETRRWDEARGITISLRSKEEAHDYRYFPDPDLVPIVIEREWVEKLKSELPELPDARKKRYVEEYGLPAYDAEVITASKALANFFEQCVSLYHDPKTISNWVMSEMMGILNETGREVEDIPLGPEHLVKMLKMIDDGTISGKIAKEVFREMFDTGKDPEAIVKEKGLVQISDEAELEKVARKVIEENPKSVEDYRNGKEKAIGFLVGQVMKETRGKANPQLVNKILKELLK